MNDPNTKTIIPKQIHDDIRLLTFNVNGIRTFFHYYPFSEMKESLPAVFDYFDADIISFQELKTDNVAISKWGKVEGFYSFISIPQVKKGYSGVGCWIKIFPKGHPLHNSMKVIKAEEGITGLLTVKVEGKNIRYRDDATLSIGGYDNLGIDDEAVALNLDSEGRCVVVELACNMVIISVYCPANSGLTKEGEIFRMNFIKMLFRRIRNLDKLGKTVVLLGDINICRDLIDSADCLSHGLIKIDGETKGTDIESNHQREVSQFILNPEMPHRRLLNQLLTDSMIPELAKDGILIDSTRYKQTRDRLKMYTVWNTLKNTRPANFGSRIDLILITDGFKNNITNADILPFVMGSDHCPVYTDLSFNDAELCTISKIPRFEARYRYNLMNHNILSMFASGSKKSSSKLSAASSDSLSFSKVSKSASTKRTKSIDSFFKGNGISKTKRTASDIAREHLAESRNISISAKRAVKQGNIMSLKDVFGKPPMCKHDEDAILKTSKTSQNPGKRFWACNRPLGDPNEKESSCGFFKWI